MIGGLHGGGSLFGDVCDRHAELGQTKVVRSEVEAPLRDRRVLVRRVAVEADRVGDAGFGEKDRRDDEFSWRLT